MAMLGSLLLLFGVGSGCGPASVTQADGGGDAGDAGQNDGGAGGPGPSFVVLPSLSKVEAQAFEISFETNVPTRVDTAWLAAGNRGRVQNTDFVAKRKLRVEGLPAGRSVQLQFSVFDSQGRVAGAGLEGRTGLLRSGPIRVLFDAAHGQRAGNADWVVDRSGATPTPSTPGAEDDWDGAYSAFGYDLFRSGRYEISILPSGSSFGQGGQSLAGIDVVVIPEPNSRLSNAEIDTLDAFVRGGGGLLLIGDHGGSDRNGNGYDSVDIINEASRRSGWGVELVGNRTSGVGRVVEGDLLGDGPFGPASLIGFFSGSSVRLALGAPAGLRLFAQIPGRSQIVMGGALGSGRILLHGDSSAADDGTASAATTNIFNAWSDPEQQNNAFFLNAVSYLAGEY